jgi:electron transfer flavoprotein alpha subunit
MSTLVIAEHDNSNLKPSTLNTLAAANAIGGSVHLLVAGSSCQAVADACAAVDGVEKVLLADDAAYANQLAQRILLSQLLPIIHIFLRPQLPLVKMFCQD